MPLESFLFSGTIIIQTQKAVNLYRFVIVL